MEVEIPRESLDCSSYWEIAMVTDNSHVVHLDIGRTRTKNGRMSISLITSYATTVWASRDWQKIGKTRMKRIEDRIMRTG